MSEWADITLSWPPPTQQLPRPEAVAGSQHILSSLIVQHSVRPNMLTKSKIALTTYPGKSRASIYNDKEKFGERKALRSRIKYKVISRIRATLREQN